MNDTDSMIQPPLSQQWERAAMKELTDVAHLLTHGMFEDYADFCDRLLSAAEVIRQMAQIYELPPSTRPEINAIDIQHFVER